MDRRHRALAAALALVGSFAACGSDPVPAPERQGAWNPADPEPASDLLLFAPPERDGERLFGNIESSVIAGFRRIDLIGPAKEAITI